MQEGSALRDLLDRLLASTSLDVARILDRVLAGHEVTIEEGERLFDAHGHDLLLVTLVADELRRRAVGDVVTYVVNRNINFTNVCIKRCGFCAFSRGHREEQGYFLPLEEIVRRAKEAWELGATEVCIQAGLPPKMDPDLYPTICRAIKAELPEIHIHGFSPEEVVYGALRARCSIEEYLLRLKEAGVGSLPGTSAEILDDEVRRMISPGRITTAQWIEVITTAHRLGIPTTATIMYGHVETNRHRAAHLALIREIQKETGGFTEFVPLSLVHSEAPMYRKRLIPGLRPGATGEEVVKMHAIARIMLHPYVRNIQVSWVKEGPKLAQWCLNAGANDLGGTLINESISTAAGATYGQLVPPRELRRWIRDAGRIPAERTTLYELRTPLTDDDPPHPLDEAAEHPERFGSYFELIRDERFAFRKHYRIVLQQVTTGSATPSRTPSVTGA
ncbi:MAG: 5-amino-6-(D-ribitylamino)uracil--L-tyrosine 4-hydroxyphenyl transferase CofH [Thermomicrobium sp.]|nr:5-amino-6-(D-ribitylamino)uracil--L-tyrosine 4-hydroxyphenyl transferase CofH [Thermomicrobium sp.]MDW8006261.1 5-amino-6-(D-ribitylamino)uracil--L-tyrosine 4-hydroxyphenyl transferase CofH [Thermomicrobium sp.]